MKATRVLLANDYALVRAGIGELIAAIDGVEIIAETGDGHEILRLIEELRPDVVLVEFMMLAVNGFEVLEETTKRFPGVRMIVLNMQGSGEEAIPALRAGAAGCLHTSAAGSELEEAIKTVSLGEVYVSEEISRKALLGFSKNTTEPGYLFDKLSPRQREVLTLIAEGYTTKGIRHALNISVKTVESHRAQLMERLNIHDVASLVRYAIRMGLVKV